MVLLTITASILTATKACQERCDEYNLPADISQPLLESPKVGDPISHFQILTISRTLKPKGDLPQSIPFHLDDLLRGSKIYHEPPPPRPEPASEYKALMARLRREEEARQYERMINPPLPMETFQQRFPNSNGTKLFFPSRADIGEDDETTYADVNRQMALIMNVLVSIVACSVAIWLAARHWSTPSRLGLSMGGSGMVGVAEVVVYAGYIRRLKEAREKGKKQLEVKEILKTWIIGGDEQANAVSVPVTSQRTPAEEVRKRITRSKETRTSTLAYHH